MLDDCSRVSECAPRNEAHPGSYRYLGPNYQVETMVDSYATRYQISSLLTIENLTERGVCCDEAIHE